MEYVRKEGRIAAVYTVGRGEKYRLLELIPASVLSQIGYGTLGGYFSLSKPPCLLLNNGDTKSPIGLLEQM